MMTRSVRRIATWAVLAAGATVGFLPAGTAQANPLCPESAAHQQQPTIVETAVEADGFSTLVAALQAADLVETLQGEGPFTVFAPTDEAFAALPEGTVESLLEPENRDMLRAILTYHVVPARVTAADLVEYGAGRARTVNGERLTFRVDDGTVTIGDATVVQADIECANGVIHVIDNVLIPDQS